MMRSSAIGLTILLLVVVGCTAEPPPEEPTGSLATSPPEQANVVPNVVGENFLEALVAIDPGFRLLDVRYRMSSAPNGLILRQRPPAGTVIDPTEAEIQIRVVVALHRD